MYRWKPSKTARLEFADTMTEIDRFCIENGIRQSSSSDSYYFEINNVSYRVSNHTTERSYINSNGRWHTDDDPNMVCITAGKTRIMQIYNDLKSGCALDKRGFRKE